MSSSTKRATSRERQLVALLMQRSNRDAVHKWYKKAADSEQPTIKGMEVERWDVLLRHAKEIAHAN